jgi:MarR family 2-MHQ and catechol resistance regulon transcriptional repressor
MSKAMPKPDTSGVHLWLVLMKAHRTLFNISTADIVRFGLCFSDFAILEILLNKGPMPVNTVGDKAFLTSGSSTAAIDRLARRGLVRRAPDKNDRRTRVVHLTGAGRKLIAANFLVHARVMEHAAHALSRAERSSLISLLKKLGKTATFAARKQNLSS